MTLPFPHQRERLLSDFSTFGIGGPARYFAEVHSCEELQRIVASAAKFSLKMFILGKGSNTLFDDRGFNGLVLLNRIDYLKQQGNLFHAGSGYSFPRLGGITARGGWAGLEFASGIPATIGGALYMNAGANGKECADTLVEVHYLTEKNELIRLTKSELAFGYRTSLFQKKSGVIVEATFALTQAEGVHALQKKILHYRLQTQPYGEKSAGCIFRNPPQCSAGALIEECGLKGKERGGAAVSQVHANFIINRGNARAADILNLIEEIKQRVYQKKQIVLQEEVRYIPYE